MQVKRESGPDAWVFRWYDETRGKRTYRKRVIGTVDRMTLRRDAEKAVLQHRVNINSGVVTPETVRDLINHYKSHELTEDSGKRSSTREVYTGVYSGMLSEREFRNRRLTSPPPTPVQVAQEIPSQLNYGRDTIQTFAVFATVRWSRGLIGPHLAIKSAMHSLGPLGT